MEILKIKKKHNQIKSLSLQGFKITINPIYGGYQRGLTSMIYKFFDKKSKGSDIKNEINENQ